MADIHVVTRLVEGALEVECGTVVLSVDRSLRVSMWSPNDLLPTLEDLLRAALTMKHEVEEQRYGRIT